MKTAISVPDDVFDDAERLAATLGLSRSELYAKAVRDYLAKHAHQDVTAQLNELYAQETSHVASDVERAQARSVAAIEW